MVVSWHVAVAGADWTNRPRAHHHLVDHHDTGTDGDSARDIRATDTHVKRQNFYEFFCELNQITSGFA